MSDTPQVWIGCLASYNAGRLIGKWVDATDADEMYEAQKRVGAEALEAAKKAGEYPIYFGDPEEFFIADYDNFGTLPNQLGEYPSFETVARIGANIEEHGAAYIAYLEACEVDLNDEDQVSENAFYEHYRGEWDSEEEYAQHEVDELGWAGVPAQVNVGESWRPSTINVFDELSSYLDWESIARELFQHGTLASVKSPDYKVFVFETEV